jgi:hypothetical protein
MAPLLAKRLSVYVALLVVLSALLLGGEMGLLTDGTSGGAGIFKPPKDKTLASFDMSDTDGERRDSPVPTRDAFEDDLRLLAANSGRDGPADAAAGSVLAPTAEPTATPAGATAEAKQARQFDPDDARSVFSELQPTEGSQVTDPLGGVVIRAPRAAPMVATPQLTPSGRSWVRGQARGYTMLYAMQPQARPVVEANVQALLGSRVREPYIGVLIDGTFGRDFAYLKDIASRLSADGRSLTMVLYLSNGPTMRKWDVTPIDQHIFARISPEEFRLQIRRNMALRAEFLAVVLQAKDVFAYNMSLGAGNSNVAIVMLEDNLDVLAYRALREIAAEQLSTMAGFVRNPCLGCGVSGNDDITLGDPREEHALQRFDILKAGDGFSLDGVGFRYPDGDGTGATEEQLTNYLTESMRRELRYFGLWREEWQGVKGGVPNKRPEERTYVAPSADQQSFEITMLRTGLIAETEEESVDESAPSP